jgi:hypothetical protein
MSSRNDHTISSTLLQAEITTHDFLSPGLLQSKVGMFALLQNVLVTYCRKIQQQVWANLQ